MLTLDLDSLLAVGAACRDRRDRLIQLIGDQRRAPELHHEADRDWKTAQAEGRNKEFLWRGLVRVHTTIQGVRTYARFEKAENQPLWAYSALQALDTQQRKERFRELVGAKSDTNFRVKNLMAAFDEVGGADNLLRRQHQMSALKGAAKKVDYLSPSKGQKGAKPFKGFGPKYARLFWLDIGDHDVSNRHVAIDSRIQKIFALLWPHFDCDEGEALVAKATETEDLYRKLEKPLVAIAEAADVTPWRADRIMFRMFDTKARGQQYISYVKGERSQSRDP